MTEQLLEFLKEQRHIFGSCPSCQEVFRLSEVRVSYKAAYKHDWLDLLEAKIEGQQAKEERFEQKRAELRQKHIDFERRTRLPKLLNAAVPMFAKRKVFPQDVKTLFDPIDFVVFDGMNNGGLVKRVLLLDNKPKTTAEKTLHTTIQNAIDTKALSWHTIQISAEGKIA